MKLTLHNPPDGYAAEAEFRVPKRGEHILRTDQVGVLSSPCDGDYQRIVLTPLPDDAAEDGTLAETVLAEISSELSSADPINEVYWRILHRVTDYFAANVPKDDSDTSWIPDWLQPGWLVRGANGTWWWTDAEPTCTDDGWRFHGRMVRLNEHATDLSGFPEVNADNWKSMKFRIEERG